MRVARTHCANLLHASLMRVTRDYCTHRSRVPREIPARGTLAHREKFLYALYARATENCCTYRSRAPQRIASRVAPARREGLLHASLPRAARNFCTRLSRAPQEDPARAARTRLERPLHLSLARAAKITALVARTLRKKLLYTSLTRVARVRCIVCFNFRAHGLGVNSSIPAAQPLSEISRIASYAVLLSARALGVALQEHCASYSPLSLAWTTSKFPFNHSSCQTLSSCSARVALPLAPRSFHRVSPSAARLPISLIRPQPRLEFQGVLDWPCGPLRMRSRSGFPQLPDLDETLRAPGMRFDQRPRSLFVCTRECVGRRHSDMIAR